MSGFNESAHPRHPAGSSKGGEFAGKGTANPAESLFQYQGYGYGPINDMLRSEGASTARAVQGVIENDGTHADPNAEKEAAEILETFRRKELEDAVVDIDGLIEAQPSQQVHVFRGDGGGVSVALFESRLNEMEGFNFSIEDMMDSMAVSKKLTERFKGDVFQDKAFLSTSTDKDMALEHFVPGAYDVTQYGGSGLVEIYGATKSLNVDEITHVGAKEGERLLPRGTKLEVERVDLRPHPDGKRVYLHWVVKIV